MNTTIATGQIDIHGTGRTQSITINVAGTVEIRPGGNNPARTIAYGSPAQMENCDEANLAAIAKIRWFFVDMADGSCVLVWAVKSNATNAGKESDIREYYGDAE